MIPTLGQAYMYIYICIYIYILYIGPTLGCLEPQGLNELGEVRCDMVY